MKKSGGVVAIAVIDFAGSGLLLALGGLILLAAVAQLGAITGGGAAAPAAAERAGQLSAIALVYMLPAAWGILTGIGMLRLRLWALASTLVFAYLLLCAGAGIGITAAWTPIPVSTATTEGVVRMLVALVGLGMAGLGGWWLAYGSRRSVRVRFGASGGWARRPLSVSLLGWLGVVVGIGCGLAALPRHASVTVYDWSATGAVARAVYVGLGVGQLVIGLGLLRLRRWARRAGLVLYALAVGNSIVMWAFPRGMERSLQTLIAANPAMANASAQQELFAYLLLGSLSGVITGWLCLYFLWTRRAAFYPPPPAAGAVVEEAPEISESVG